jgi:hypothetical protein
MKPSSIGIRVGAYVSIAILGGVSWITSGTLNLEPAKYLSATVFVGSALFTAWELWVWRFPWMQLIPGVPLCVRGTWKGMLESSWIDASGQKIAPKNAYLVVRQTFSSVQVTLLTDESKSDSSLAAVAKTEGLSVLHYLFFNKPKMKHEAISRMHHGSTTLEVSGKPARRMAGRYWTDRDSRGELEFDRHSRKIADDYDEAVSFF